MLSLPGLNVKQTWSTLSGGEKKILVPHLVDYAAAHLDSSRQKEIRELLNQERDPFLAAYARVAAVYFRTQVAAERISRLRRITSGPREVYEFHQNVERVRAGEAREGRHFAGICKYPGQQAACELARLRQSLDRISARKQFSTANLREVMFRARPFLARAPVRPPFYFEVAGDLPEQLYALGMPLEAAIFARRMTQPPADRELIQPLSLRIPYYLSAAADFDSAVRLSTKTSARQDPVLVNARLDWMILAGRYREALNYIHRIGPARLVENAGSRRDYWSGFKVTQAEVQLRSAMLLYLAGDVQKAADALERLTEIKGVTSTGEPARHFARLRLAQILLKKNPELAHKIAEDLTYIAQENSWHVLEYHATVLDGWAQFYRNSHYRASINFIKARGILPAHLKKHGAEYSRLLGLLTTRNRLKPGGNYSALIRQINALLIRRPYNEAIFSIREWAPAEIGPQWFLLEAARNSNLRKRRWEALNILLEFNFTMEFSFTDNQFKLSKMRVIY